MLAGAFPPRAQGGTAVGTGAAPDARRLPLADGSADAIFAAGLVNHLPDTKAHQQAARVTRPGHSVPHDEPLAEGPLRRSTAASGWRLTAYDDAPQRFLAVAKRQ